jgi:hypothetical protein
MQGGVRALRYFEGIQASVKQDIILHNIFKTQRTQTKTQRSLRYKKMRFVFAALAAVYCGVAAGLKEGKEPLHFLPRVTINGFVLER